MTHELKWSSNSNSFPYPIYSYLTKIISNIFLKLSALSPSFLTDELDSFLMEKVKTIRRDLPQGGFHGFYHGACTGDSVHLLFCSEGLSVFLSKAHSFWTSPLLKDQKLYQFWRGIFFFLINLFPSAHTSYPSHVKMLSPDPMLSSSYLPIFCIPLVTKSLQSAIHLPYLFLLPMLSFESL